MTPKRFTTVNTAAADQLLCAVSDVKADLGISGTSEDSYLTRLVASASAEIARYCGRVFKQETVAETFHIDQTAGRLFLSRRPVASITSVVEDGDTLSASLYQVDDANGYLYRLDDNANLSRWCPVKVVVTYVGGYSTIPADLEAACIALVKARRAARLRDPALRSEEVPDVLKQTFWVAGASDGAIPPDIASTLEQYKRLIT